MSYGQNPPLRGTGTALPKISDVVSATLRKQGVQFELVTYQGSLGTKPERGSFSHKPVVYTITNREGVAYVGSSFSASVRICSHLTECKGSTGLSHVEQGDAYEVSLFYIDQPRNERTRLEQLVMDALKAERVHVCNFYRSNGSHVDCMNKLTGYSDGTRELTQSRLNSRISAMRQALNGTHGRKAQAILSFQELHRVGPLDTEEKQNRGARVERILKGIDLALKFGQCEFLANAMNESGSARGRKAEPLTADQIKARLVELEMLAPWM